ncbi:MAG: thiol-disulfide oxidoreductase DCC family protein [Coraliomargarita sp.]
MSESSKMVVYFDGVCNLCNRAVDFIIRHDADARIRFASLQSAHGQAVLARLGLSLDELKTIVFEQDGVLYVKSDAALKIAAVLDGPVSWFAWFLWIPRFLRDPLYMLISNNRYRWFGKKSSCRLPTADERKRFIES